jgi:hypothetical protein
MTIPQPAEIWYWQGEMAYKEHHLIVALIGTVYRIGEQRDQEEYEFQTLCLETGEPDIIYYRQSGRWERV